MPFSLFGWRSKGGEERRAELAQQQRVGWRTAWPAIEQAAQRVSEQTDETGRFLDLFGGRQDRPNRQAEIAEGFAPRGLEGQSYAFRGIRPEEEGARRAAEFGRVAGERPGLYRTLAQDLEQRGLSPEDLVAGRTGTPYAPGTTDERRRDLLGLPPEGYLPPAGITAPVDQARDPLGRPYVDIGLEERASAGQVLGEVLSPFEKEVDLFRPVTEPVGRFLAGSVAENVPVAGPLIGMIPQERREAVGSEVAAQTLVPSNIVGPLGVVGTGTALRGGAKLLGRETAEQVGRGALPTAAEVAQGAPLEQVAGRETITMLPSERAAQDLLLPSERARRTTGAIAEPLPVEAPLRRGAAAEVPVTRPTEGVAAPRLGAEAAEGSPPMRARISAEAAPPSSAADIEDALPRIDPDAPPVPRPAIIGGGTEAFAAPLRPIEDVAGEVVTSDNPVVRAVIGRTGINPSVLENDPLGKATVAYWRQRVAGEQLTDVAVAAASDVHAQRVTGLRPNIVIPQSGKGAGIVRNVTPTSEGASRVWQDVYSRPGAYRLKPTQRAEIDDYLRVVDETEFLRVQAGLKPRATRGPEAVADGWFYVPRQVKGIRGVELRRPSNPGLQRHYEEAAEGMARGVRYDANPRATLELHVRNAYKEIADKQLSDYIEQLQAEAIQRGERLFLTPKELVPESVIQRISQATLNRMAAERALRGLRGQQRSLEVGVQPRGIAEAAKTELRGARQPQRTALQGEIARAQDNVDAAMRNYQSAKGQYSKALETARKAEVAPGSKFGQDANTIPIKMWRNRFFPREQAERLQAGIEEFFKPIEQSPFVKGAMTVGNSVRFLSAVGDFAEPFIQGQLVFGASPRVWARATLRHYQGFLDPTVQARIVRDYLPEFQEMAAHGTPIGDQEFFAALREGGGPSAGKLLEILPKGQEARNLLQNAGRQTFGRFQASYNTGLASSRAGLTRSMKVGIPDAAERQAFIRNVTGGLDSRALGVAPAQRSLEGFALAFSPRLLRSTVALIGDLRLGLRNPRGLAAYRSLGTLAASATGLYVLSGLALGKSWDEIETGLNPLNGKKFMSHEVNGDWIGIGGQVRSIFQLMSRVAAEPESLASLDTFDNPLIAFYQSRGAPALNLVGGAVEATTGANAAPYDQIDNLPDFFKHVGTSALPFAVQGILEGQKPITSLAGLVGARTSPPTSARSQAYQLRQELQAMPAYEGLEPSDQNKVEEFLSRLDDRRAQWRREHPGDEQESRAESIARLAPRELDDPTLVRWARVLASDTLRERNASRERDRFLLDNFELFDEQYPDLLPPRIRELHERRGSRR